jgi:hypothetical protein
MTGRTTFHKHGDMELVHRHSRVLGADSLTERANMEWRGFENCGITGFPFRQVTAPLKQSDRFSVCPAQ